MEDGTYADDGDFFDVVSEIWWLLAGVFLGHGVYRWKGGAERGSEKYCCGVGRWKGGYSWLDRVAGKRMSKESSSS